MTGRKFPLFFVILSSSILFVWDLGSCICQIFMRLARWGDRQFRKILGFGDQDLAFVYQKDIEFGLRSMVPYGAIGAHIKTGRRHMEDHFQTPLDWEIQKNDKTMCRLQYVRAIMVFVATPDTLETFTITLASSTDSYWAELTRSPTWRHTLFFYNASAHLHWVPVHASLLPISPPRVDSSKGPHRVNRAYWPTKENSKK